MKPLHGTFYIPGKPRQKFGGILRRTDGGLQLEVVGWDDMSDRHEVMVGLFADGRPATLVELQRTKMQVGVHGQRPLFRVWHALIGWHYKRLSNIEFDRMSVSFTDLSAWWAWRRTFTFSEGSGPTRSFPLPGPSIQMHYDRAPAMTAVLPDVVIEAGPREEQHSGARRYEIETTARVSFEYSSRQSLKRLYVDLDAMEALLWTVLDQPSLARAVIAEDKRHKAPVFGGKSKVTQPVEVRTTLRTRRPLRRGHQLFPRPEDIAPYFDDLCRGWFGRWQSDHDVLWPMAEAEIESSREMWMSRPVQLAWYLARAKSLDAIWALAKAGRKGKVEHIRVLRDLFGSHGPLLFPDTSKAPNWHDLAIEMYGIRNDAGHGKVKMPRSLTMNEIGRGQDLIVSLGRILLLELGGLQRSVAVDWVTKGHRWQAFSSGQTPGMTL